MAILRREDGIVFVLHPYRETLSLKNKALLRKEVRYLAENQGAYVRLLARPQDYEAIFSQQAGYLLGETVWDYFEKPTDLIYCEALADSPKTLLLVVVREGKVYLDMQLTIESLSDELLPLLSENQPRYPVYIYEVVPEIFTGSAIKNIHQLPNSLYQQLPAKVEFQLLTLEQALAEHHLLPRKHFSLLSIVIVCLLGLAGVWWWSLQHTQPAPLQPQINPYEQYELALSTPAPAQQIHELVRGLLAIQQIAGWIPLSFADDGNTVKVSVQSLGGRATDLITATEKQNMNVSFGSEGAIVTFVPVVKKRTVPSQIASVQRMVALVIDRMMQILPGASVRVGETITNNVFRQTNITISFNNISPDILQLIGNNLNDFSISFINCQGQIHQGLFTGTLQLAVVGN